MPKPPPQSPVPVKPTASLPTTPPRPPNDRRSEKSRLAHDPKFVGVRHLVNIEPAPDWILRPEILDGLAAVAERDLVFDFVGILPRDLEHVPLLAERIPSLRIVIDHLGKPPIAGGGFEP